MEAHYKLLFYDVRAAAAHEAEAEVEAIFLAAASSRLRFNDKQNHGLPAIGSDMTLSVTFKNGNQQHLEQIQNQQEYLLFFLHSQFNGFAWKQTS